MFILIHHFSKVAYFSNARLERPLTFEIVSRLLTTLIHDAPPSFLKTNENVLHFSFLKLESRCSAIFVDVATFFGQINSIYFK